MQLRPYQCEALQRIMAAFEAHRTALLVLPTGCGKTVVFCGIAYRFAYKSDQTATGGRVLILAHQNILIDQAADKMETVLSIPVSREKGRTHIQGSPYPVSVSSVQTMAKRIDRFSPDYFDLIIIDEAHHSLSATYKQVIDHFSKAKILGVTATPDRADGQALKHVFEVCAYQYDIGKAIDDGYLCPIDTRLAKININISKVKKIHGDFREGDLGSAIEPYLHDIAKEVRRLAMGRRIVCFVPLIRTAQKAADIFSHYGFRPDWTSGNDKERVEKLTRFANGEIDILFNSMLLTEGWDCPETDCVIVLRPTLSRALYVQMVGRGLRLAPGKKDCLLIDFLFQSEQFNLVGSRDVLGLRKRGGAPIQIQLDNGEIVSNGFCIAPDAEQRLIEKLNRAAKKELLNPLENDRWKDALSHLPPAEAWDEPGRSATDNQKRKIRAFGYDPKPLSARQAKAILDYEDEQKPPTQAMIYRLSLLGYSREELDKFSYARALKEIKKSKAAHRW